MTEQEKALEGTAAAAAQELEATIKVFVEAVVESFRKAMEAVKRFVRAVLPILRRRVEEIQRQTATIDAYRARARKMDYRKAKNQRRKWAHWRRRK